jgi:DNA-binding transcriptional LysR family regulator
VSQQLRRLQDHFGFEMLASDRGRLVPTDRALEVVQLAERMDRAVRHIEDIAKRESGEGTAVLRVGATASSGMYFIPGILRLLQSRHSGLHVALSIADPDEIRESLASGLRDVGAGSGDLESEGMQVTELFRSRLHPVVNPTHNGLTRRDLEQGRVMVTQDLHILLETQLRSAGVHVPSEHFTLYDEVEGVKKAVEAGLGVGFTFAPAVEREVEHGYLKCADIDGLDIVVPFKLVYPETAASDVLVRDIQTLAQLQVRLRERSQSGRADSL